jgi:hypothetical protein
VASAASATQALVRDIPDALDALITALMSIDPGRRPRSADEVIDRLTAIAQLKVDDSPAVARSFLLGSQLVGREPQCKVLRERLAEALGGKGATLAISGPSAQGARACWPRLR